MFVFDPVTIPVTEGTPTAQVCLALTGLQLMPAESLGCDVTITLSLLEGNLASMLINNAHVMCVVYVYVCGQQLRQKSQHSSLEIFPHLTLRYVDLIHVCFLETTFTMYTYV